MSVTWAGRFAARAVRSMVVGPTFATATWAARPIVASVSRLAFAMRYHVRVTSVRLGPIAVVMRHRSRPRRPAMSVAGTTMIRIRATVSGNTLRTATAVHCAGAMMATIRTTMRSYFMTAM